jgi:WhiB family transcriptional regulator, redox-sensing transcriptional regulator
MCRPGTTAVTAGTAVFEAETASQGVRPGAGLDRSAGTSQVPGPRQAPGTAARPAAVPSGPAPGAVLIAPAGPDLPCTDDPELFFAESPEDVETAKAMCRDCPARTACLTGALQRREPWGVWGGELFLRGAIVPRKRPRGRPRKTEVAA